MSKRTALPSMGGRLVRNVTSLIFGEGKEERPRPSARTSKRPAVRSKARKSGAQSASRTRRSAKRPTRTGRGQRRSTAR